MLNKGWRTKQAAFQLNKMYFSNTLPVCEFFL